MLTIIRPDYGPPSIVVSVTDCLQVGPTTGHAYRQRRTSFKENDIDQPIINKLCSVGFKCLHVPRKCRRVGSVAFILINGFKAVTQTHKSYEAF